MINEFTYFVYRNEAIKLGLHKKSFVSLLQLIALYISFIQYTAGYKKHE